MPTKHPKLFRSVAASNNLLTSNALLPPNQTSSNVISRAGVARGFTIAETEPITAVPTTCFLDRRRGHFFGTEGHPLFDKITCGPNIPKSKKGLIVGQKGKQKVICFNENVKHVVNL